MKYKSLILFHIIFTTCITAFAQKKNLITLHPKSVQKDIMLKKCDIAIYNDHSPTDGMVDADFMLGNQFKVDHAIQLAECSLYSSDGEFITFSNFLFPNLNIRKSIFKDPSDFSSSNFSHLYLDSCLFEKRIDFDYSEFQDLNINATTLNNQLSFRNAKVYGNCSFSFTNANGMVDFSNTTFNANCDFNNAIFNSRLILFHIITTDTSSIFFLNSRLPDLVDLSENSALKVLIDLTAAKLDSVQLYTTSRRWHYINLHKTNLSKIKINYQQFRICFFSDSETDNKYPFGFFNGHLYYTENGVKKTLLYDLNNISNSHMAVKTLLANTDVQDYLKNIFPAAKVTDPVSANFLFDCIQKRSFPKTIVSDEKESVYEQLLKNFKDNGQNDSYEALDIEYRDFKNGSFILPHIWNLYGYRREWVFYWALAFLAFFTITTTFFLPILNKPTAEGGVYHMDNLNIDPATERWYNRLWYAFMYTSTLFFILKVDVSKLNFKKKAGVFYIVLIYSLGVLCLGYMANFVLQK